VLTPNSKIAAAYGEPVVSERHRHRFEFNSNYKARFEANGFICSGTSPDKRLVEFIELAEHPYWVGTQAHPEFKSRPDRPHPLFRELIGAALAFRAARELDTAVVDQHVAGPRAATLAPVAQTTIAQTTVA
jgi:CTP synthase